MKRLLCAALLLCLMMMSSCAPAVPAASPAQSARPETLKLAGGTDWGAPSPYLHQSRGPGNAKKDLVFASLLEADENGVIGWMAESWQVNGNEYTFTLHENALFHDGQPLTSADVAFTVDYYRQYPPVSNPLGAGDGYLVTSYEIIDEHMIVLSVAESSAAALTALGGFEILPKHIWENVTDPYAYQEADAFIGSGAYRFSSYDAATGSYEFLAFDGFCAGTPGADRVLFVPVSDEILAFENGEIDIASMPADLSDRYLNDPAIGLVDKANDMGYKLLIQFENCPAFLDIEQRKALYAALDREAVVEKVFRGMGAVGSAGYAPPGSIYVSEDCEQYPYDPEQAKAAFAGKNHALTLLCANSGDDVKIAELIALDLEAAGITVTVVSQDSAVRDDKVNSGDYELALVGNGGWGGKAPDYMRTVFSDLSKNTGGNPHTMGPIGYSSETITQLAEAQVWEVDFDARIQLFKQLQIQVSREIPLIVIATKSSYSIYRKDYYDGWMKTYDYQQAEQNRLSFLQR